MHLLYIYRMYSIMKFEYWLCGLFSLHYFFYKLINRKGCVDKYNDVNVLVS